MGQPTVEAGIRGRLTTYSPAPWMPRGDGLYAAAAETGTMRWPNCHVVMVDYLTSDDAAAEVLPEACRLIRTPSPGTAFIELLFLSYRAEGSLEPYLEMAVSVPCLFQGDVWGYVAFIEVSTDAASASGREGSGAAKDRVNIVFEDNGDEVYCALERPEGQPAASISFGRQAKPFSVPLPPDERRALPRPFNMTMALPTAATQPRALPLRLMSLRQDRQLMGTLWKLERGQVWAGEATVDVGPADRAPLSELPPHRTLSGIFYKGDMSAQFSRIPEEL